MIFFWEYSHYYQETELFSFCACSNLIRNIQMVRMTLKGPTFPGPFPWQGLSCSELYPRLQTMDVTIQHDSLSSIWGQSEGI